jgi:hypothetical protein
MMELVGRPQWTAAVTVLGAWALPRRYGTVAAAVIDLVGLPKSSRRSEISR